MTPSVSAKARWITLEGRNGVGKTYLATAVRDVLGERCTRIAELTDVPGDSLPGQVLGALRAHGGEFLQTGAPHTETQLLMALQSHRYETHPPGRPGDVVLEDRGPLSVAVYQAAILHPDDTDTALRTARTILAAGELWRPPPAVTVLLRDDPDTCERRYTARVARPPTADERALMDRASRIYDGLTDDVAHLHVIDRRLATEPDIVAEIADLCVRATDPEGISA